MGGHSNAPTVQPSYTGLQLQTSTNALPIPIIYGVNIVAPNIIWNGDFIAIAQYSQSSGGKGGGGSPQVTGYTYETAIIMALCEGPINAIGTIWKGQSTYTLATVNPLASTLLLIMRTDSLKPASMSAFTGTTPQSVWGYLASAHATQAINYPSLAYLASPAYDLGSSGTLDVTNVEVYGVLSSTGISVTKDANPALVIQDFLTNAQYGVGFPAASIDATTLLGASGGSSFQVYCEATGIAISPALTNQETANSILTRWLQLTNTAAVWSGGRLKFIPYGDSSVSSPLPEGGGSVTFNPDLTPLYDLTDDDFVASDGEDPVQVTRTDPYAAYNLQPVEILARDNSYAPTPIIAFDQNAIDSYGLRIASTITAHEVCERTIGQVIAQLILQRGLYIRNTYNFKLSWEYCLLEPMDLVTLSDAGLGLSRTAVRVTEIEEDEDGLLSVTAEEFPGGIATAVAYPVQTSSGAGINRNIAPASVNPPLIFEPPAALTSGGEAEVWIGLSGGVNGSADPNWGGATIWISRDDTSYTAIGMVMSAARQGVLAASLPASAGQNVDVPPFDTIDVTDALTVNMAESAGELNSAAKQDAKNALTLCLIDDELIAYTDAKLIAANTYALTSLARGLYGSAPASHASGAQFTRLDNAIFKYALPSVYINSAFYLKFQSFNVFGQSAQPLADCVAYSYTPIGSSRLGSVAQALAFGANVDCGIASAPASGYDDFGLASDPYPYFIDLGSASS